VNTFASRLLLLDPGYLGFRNAIRGTAAVVLSFMALSVLAKMLNESPVIAFVGVIIAMISSLTIADSTLPSQRRTMRWMAVPACGGAAVSVLLHPFPALSMLVFLAVTFAVVFARKFGARFAAMGFVLYMSYFAPLFFPLHASDLPWVMLAMVFSLGVAYAFRFWILPDHPRRVLRLYLKAFRLHSEGIVERLEKMAAEKDFTEPSRKRVRASLHRLNELNLGTEKALEAVNLKAATNLQETLFEREIALRNLLESARRLIEGADPKFFAQNLSAVKAEISQPIASPESIRELGEEMKKCRFEPAQKVNWKAFDTITKLAIQATIATGLASALGALLSSQRWYWAAITAFIVFVGSTRGETVTRALFRVGGTVVGLAVGFVAAYGLSGHTTASWIGIIFSIFLGMLGGRFAFGFFSALAFSLMLALLFDIMHQLSGNILILRLEETAIGAGIGALVSAFILPASTQAGVKAATLRMLRAMAEVLKQLPLDPAAKRQLVASLRNVDREHLALRLAAAPIVQRLSPWRPGDTPQLLHELNGIAHFLRHLATDKSLLADGGLRLKTECEALAGNLSRYADALEKKESFAPEEIQGNQNIMRMNQLLKDLARRKL
jgi:uncharacterized membrane protein YccC